MFKTLLAAAMLATFSVGSVYAADTGSTMTPQQRMKECGPKTKGMTKEQRSAFMKQCLSKSGHDAAMAGKTGAADAKAAVSDKRSAQQEKMKSCNADAKTKKLSGADRKAFMKSCLKGG